MRSLCLQRSRIHRSRSPKHMDLIAPGRTPPSEEVRVSVIDEIGLSSGDVGTLLYRVSEESATNDGDI